MLHYKECNEFTLIDLIDLTCFGVSGMLVGGKLKLGVGIVVRSVSSCDTHQSIEG
jgi:hypothetical protein